MRRSVFRLAMLAASLWLANPAQADFVRLGAQGYGGWKIVAQRNQNNVRTRCIAIKQVNGHRVRIVTDRKNWWVGFSNSRGINRNGVVRIDRWSQRKDYKYDGVFSFVGVGQPMLRRMIRGNTLVLLPQRLNLRVSLRGSAAAIGRLRQCRTRIGRPGTGFSNRWAALKAGGGAANVAPLSDDSNLEGDFGNMSIIDEPDVALPDQLAPAIPPSPTVAPTAPSAPSTDSSSGGGAPMGVGCPAVGDIGSDASDQAVTVTFDVRTQSAGLTLYWLDGNGNPLQLGPLVAGVQTVDGHIGDVFVARDATGACLGGVMQVTPALSSFVVQ